MLEADLKTPGWLLPADEDNSPLFSEGLGPFGCKMLCGSVAALQAERCSTGEK